MTPRRLEDAAAGDQRVHRCPWPGCVHTVPERLWGCAPHWFQLPRPIRNRIYRAYRVGQTAATMSADYYRALDEADRWMATHARVDNP